MPIVEMASYLSSFVLCIKFFPNDAMDVFRVLGHSQVKMHLCLTVSSSEEGASHLKGQQFKAEHNFVLFAAAVPSGGSFATKETRA